MDNLYRPMQTIMQGGDNDKKRELTMSCVKLGLMLITYRVLTSVMASVFYMTAYAVLSGHFAGYNESVNGLVKDYDAVLRSTSFGMLMNSAVTLTSLILTLLLGSIVLGFSFEGYLRPNADGAKKGLRFFPACFMLNIVFSLMVNLFTEAMSTVGVTIPEADFSIKEPSAAAVVFQFIYLTIIAPLVEEIVYRGMILGALSKYGEVPAIVFSALCFGLMHGNIPQATAAFFTGLAYASLAVSSRSIMPSLLVHSLNNLLVDMEELGSSLNIPYISTVTAAVQVAVAAIGVYIMLTRYSYFRHDGENALPGKGEVAKVIYTMPVIIVYLLMLVWSVIEGILRVN